MKVKYNRVSTINQSGNRFNVDDQKYDKIIFDKESGSTSFRDRDGGKEIERLVLNNELDLLVVEDLSRLGRNTGDVINTLEWLDKNEINVFIRNIGLESRPINKKNPVWKIITSVLSSMYEMELENIKERTHYGRMIYLKNGGKLGRPEGSNESKLKFLNKPKSRRIKKLLDRGLSLREIASISGSSYRTIIKVKTLSSE